MKVFVAVLSLLIVSCGDSDATGFLVSGRTVLGIAVNGEQTTGHYLTVDTPFTFWDNINDSRRDRDSRGLGRTSCAFVIPPEANS